MHLCFTPYAISKTKNVNIELFNSAIIVVTFSQALVRFDCIEYKANFMYNKAGRIDD